MPIIDQTHRHWHDQQIACIFQVWLLMEVMINLIINLLKALFIFGVYLAGFGLQQKDRRKKIIYESFDSFSFDSLDSFDSFASFDSFVSLVSLASFSSSCSFVDLERVLNLT